MSVKTKFNLILAFYLMEDLENQNKSELKGNIPMIDPQQSLSSEQFRTTTS